jgi:carbon starvation protein
MSNSLRRYGIWVGIAIVGAVCWGMLALARGETVNAGWMLFAALASYAIAFRFYARFIRDRVLGVDDSRATPGERLNNGRDFEPMDRRVLFGHHFAAIAGAGPLRRWATCRGLSGSSSASYWPAPSRT